MPVVALSKATKVEVRDSIEQDVFVGLDRLALKQIFKWLTCNTLFIPHLTWVFPGAISLWR